MYDQAMEKYANNLPTKKQFEELMTSCQWTWTSHGYKVEGPNNVTIYMPAAGSSDCYGNENNIGSVGAYWSSTLDESGDAWGLSFGSGGIYMIYDHYRCGGNSVRLVKHKEKIIKRASN